MRVPYAGYLDQLDAQFAAGLPAWEVSRYQGYRARESARPGGDRRRGPAVVPSVYTDLLAFRFCGLKPQSQLTVRLTEALRSAVLQVAGRDAPAVAARARRRRAPARGVPRAARRRPRARRRSPAGAGGGGPRPAGRRAQGGAPRGARAAPRRSRRRRSSCPCRASARSRCSTSPGWSGPGVAPSSAGARAAALGRRPRRWSSTATRSARARSRRRCAPACAGSGCPNPIDVEISVEPLIPGAARLRPADLPAQSKGRLFRHIAVTFDRRVSGPVLVGAGRYLGVGLLAPVGGAR